MQSPQKNVESSVPYVFFYAPKGARRPGPGPFAQFLLGFRNGGVPSTHVPTLFLGKCPSPLPPLPPFPRHFLPLPQFVLLDRSRRRPKRNHSTTITATVARYGGAACFSTKFFRPPWIGAHGLCTLTPATKKVL